MIGVHAARLVRGRDRRRRAEPEAAAAAPARQSRVGIAALTTVPLLFAGTVLLLALAVFLSGVAISPTFITAFGLIERRVPEAKLTEGVTWVMTGIGIGMALGSFATGWAIDLFGARNGFWVSVIAGPVPSRPCCSASGRSAVPARRHQAHDMASSPPRP